MFKEQGAGYVVDYLPSSSVDIKNLVEHTATCNNFTAWY